MIALLFMIQTLHWTSFVNPQPIYDMVSQGNNIWAATSGGILIFNKVDSSFQQITNTNGLPRNLVAKVSTDRYGNIWLLCVGGGLVVMTPDMNTKKTFTYMDGGLPSYNFSSIFIDGDSVWIGTDDFYKVWLYDMNGNPFTNTEEGKLLKNIQPSNEIRDIKIFGDSIWFCTNKGIGKTNKSLDSFIVYNSSNGLPNDTVYTVEKWDNYMWAGTKKGIARLHKDSTKWERVDTSFNVKEFCAVDTALWIACSQGTFKCNLIGDTSCTWTKIADYDSRALLFNNTLWIGSAWNGIVKYDGNLHEYNKKGSATNYFVTTTLDLEGNIWATHWAGEPDWEQNKASKLYKDSLGEWKWKLYAFPVPKTTNVLVDRYNNKWITMADWDNPAIVGVVKVLSNDSLIYIKVDEGWANYITASCLDKDGNLWIQCQDAYIRKINGITNQVDTTASFRNTDYTSWASSMAMDNENNLWIGSVWPSKCLVIFKNGVYDKTLLSGEQAFFINMEKQPAVWVGTTKAIYKFTDMQIKRSYAVSAIGGGIPSDMAADSTGIWFAINPCGIKKLNSNGEFYKSYTTADGLVDDRALGVEVDSKNQVLWVGTANGLSRLVETEDTTHPVISRFKVKFHPNPFVASRGDKEIVFQLDTLTFTGGKVNIYTLSGKILRTIENNGEPTAVWDTKDKSGKLVPSGIYLFAAYPKDKEKQIGKLAIIR